MAVVYTHSVILWFMLIFVLQDVTEGIVSSTKGHLRRKDITDDYERLTSKSNRGHRHRNEVNKTQIKINEEVKKDSFINVTGQTGSRVILHCNTSLLDAPGKENVTIIWVRLRNDSFSLLTEGKNVKTEDKRFLTEYQPDKDYILHIRYTRASDEGLYKCQFCAGANSSRSIYVTLNLIEARAEIIGDPVREVDKVGAPLRLSCELKDSIEAPKYIYWYHDDRVINYDLNDGATVRDGRQGSELIFPRAQEHHAGNYSCVPSNARPASVLVVVNAKPYALKNSMKNNGEQTHPRHHILNMLVLISTFLLYR